MRDGDWLIGWGCATSTYPSNIGPAAARLSLTPPGKATIEMAGHEIGTGAYTVAAITVARGLGLQIEDVSVFAGRQQLPAGHRRRRLQQHRVDDQCDRQGLRGDAQPNCRGGGRTSDGVFAGADPATLKLEDGGLVGPDGRREPLRDALGRVAGGTLEVLRGKYARGAAGRRAMADLYKGKSVMLRGEGRKDVTAFAFGAHFIEVRIHR